MPLQPYEPILREVKGADGRALGTVRGLALHDLRKLVQIYLDAAEGLAGLIQRAANSKDPLVDALRSVGGEDIETFIFSLVRDVPELAVKMIALAGDAEGGEDAIARMPLGVQIAILEQVFEATFTEVGGVKKFWVVLGQMVARMLPQDTAPNKEPNEAS